MKNTFTIKVRTIGQDEESREIKGVTSIMSNLGGFLVYTESGAHQLEPETRIIIRGSDDAFFNRD